MQNLAFEIVNDGNIEQCRELCNELMALQKAKAHRHPDLFDLMNFDTRMKKSFAGALRKQVIVAKDNGIPVGYVFSTVDTVTEADRTTFPAWAPKSENGLGFYPGWVKLPQNIGCLSNLYLRDTHRGSGLGARLLHRAMEWLDSFADVDLIFVFISNGNSDALNFYQKHGFAPSHDVFGGFIQAMVKERSRSPGS